jgi:hypothetical protein
VAVNVNRIDGAASEVGMDFWRVIVPDFGPQAWGCDSYSCSYSDSCLGCVVDASEVDLRFVSDSSRGHGRGRNRAHDHRPWASRGEGEVASPLLDPLAPFASYPPRDASACPSPSFLFPTSPFELATSLVPPLASPLAQPSQ